MDRSFLTSPVVPIAAVFAACVGFGLRAIQYPWNFDDSFISCRFSANLARGHGLVNSTDSAFYSARS